MTENHQRQVNVPEWIAIAEAAFQDAVRRSGVGPVHWRSLRHTFASWAVRNGVTLHELMQLGGWASYSMVLRYGHLAPDHLAEAAEKVTNFSHKTRTPVSS